MQRAALVLLVETPCTHELAAVLLCAQHQCSLSECVCAREYVCWPLRLRARVLAYRFSFRGYAIRERSLQNDVFECVCVYVRTSRLQKVSNEPQSQKQTNV